MSVVEVRRWEPFGIAVSVLAGAPALLEQFVIRAAGQGELVDIGAPADGPCGDMMHLALIARHVTARAGATAIFGVKNDPLPRCGQPFGVIEPDRLTPIKHRQIVMRVTSQPDHIRHRQQRAPTGQPPARGGLQLLQRGRHDDRRRQPVMLPQLSRRQHRPQRRIEPVMLTLTHTATVTISGVARHRPIHHRGLVLGVTHPRCGQLGPHRLQPSARLRGQPPANARHPVQPLPTQAQTTPPRPVLIAMATIRIEAIHQPPRQPGQLIRTKLGSQLRQMSLGPVPGPHVDASR